MNFLLQWLLPFGAFIAIYGALWFALYALLHRIFNNSRVFLFVSRYRITLVTILCLVVISRAAWFLSSVKEMPELSSIQRLYDLIGENNVNFLVVFGALLSYYLIIYIPIKAFKDIESNKHATAV
jgi:hypothetical protein